VRNHYIFFMDSKIGVVLLQAVKSDTVVSFLIDGIAVKWE